MGFRVQGLGCTVAGSGEGVQEPNWWARCQSSVSLRIHIMGCSQTRFKLGFGGTLEKTNADRGTSVSPVGNSIGRRLINSHMSYNLNSP